ncbi:MAG: DNA methyltransferase [Anaerolineaceae bacterium]|nr:DNA methyltransferase [Anaerolineaceae bacterium]MDE0327925.1 DNA methyltransferase [Anaerolineaceae bacterium]
MPTKLNDLSGKEWLPRTRSVFVDGVENPNQLLSWENVSASFSVMSTATARPPSKKEHPATFPESDARRLIKFFTKTGESVLDPFMGAGSTAVACVQEQRACTGFELYERWARLARERVREADKNGIANVEIRTVDALKGLAELETGSQSFILTSPPYWSILNKKDHKASSERVANGLETDYGKDSKDLAQIEHYGAFLAELGTHFKQWQRVLQDKAYAAAIVSDFRHGSRYYPFHAHVGEQMEMAGLMMQGLIVIVQDSKRLYPYGFPSSYVPNICNQFVVVGRKL